MPRTCWATIAVALLASAALAHEGGMHEKGTVKAITATSLELQTAQGEKTFAITPRTEFVKGRAAAKASDLRPGDRVVVHARLKDGVLEATEVRGAGARAPAPAR